MIKSPNDTSFTTLMKEKKMMISKDVEFDEEGAWNSKVDDCEKYDFLPVFDEKDERYEGHQKLVTSQRSLMNSTSNLSYSSSESFVGEFRLPHARTGGVLIVAQRRVKHTDTIFYVVRQNRLHPRERVHII
jgi:hypothetical protein